MSDVLQDFSAPALVWAIEENLDAFIPRVQGWPPAEVYLGPDLWWQITSIPNADFNYVGRARLAPEQADGAIADVIERCGARRVPAQWCTGPATRPIDLPARLLAHGFTLAGEDVGMAVDLQAFDDSLPAPEGLYIERVHDRAGLEAWSRLAPKPPADPAIVAAYVDLFTHFGIGPEGPFHLYVGWWRDEPVAISSLLTAVGVGGVYYVITAPQARRRGIGTAMTLAALRTARALGYRVGVLQASPMGEPVYRRLGFKEYCRLPQFYWTLTTPRS
jgi:GNAT superfamily N-acetyltransferase